MSTNNEKLKEILSGIYNDLKNLQVRKEKVHYLNERYLHHCFSHAVQIKGLYCLNYEDPFSGAFHPEWTTRGEYKGENGVYQFVEKGSRGNIDFALGKYYKPDYGIEFKHSQGWKRNPLLFDYMKLLDSENPIQKAISVAVIFRENDLSTQLTTEKVNETIGDLKDRFKEQKREIADGRPFLFWIIEVAPKAEKSEKIRSWYCNNLTDGFQLSTPPEDPLEKAWFKE